MAEKQKLSSELDAKHAAMQASEETADKRHREMDQAIKDGDLQKQSLESEIATLTEALNEVQGQASELKKQSSTLASKHSSLGRKIKKRISRQ